jgi:hypothetical protein
MATGTPGKGLQVRGNGAPAQGSGETYTHGHWQQAYQMMRDCLKQLPVALDALLSDLRATDVGRTQAAGMIRFADGARTWGQLVEQTLNTIDPIALPVVEAVTAAGGPEDVNGMPYYREV